MEYMDFLSRFMDLAGLWGVAISAFLSSTVLPGMSEVYAIGYATQNPTQILEVLVVASVGNTLGAMTTWGLGRIGARFAPVESQSAHRVARWGAPVLLFSWVPVIGDGLTLAAGWLKTGFWISLFYIAVGKTARYAALLWVAGHLTAYLFGGSTPDMTGVQSL